MAYSNPPDPKAYAAQVYAIVRQIPPGRVTTYGQIAQMILPPAGVDPATCARLSPRWVGAAMAQCPDDVPWQRVINSQGKVSPRPGYGPMVQRALLEQEGVVFDEKERVDLKKYGWPPKAQETEGPPRLF
jgi:methylated-DNA-protein-cysteine methyltransferase-like protein